MLRDKRLETTKKKQSLRDESFSNESPRLSSYYHGDVMLSYMMYLIGI